MYGHMLYTLTASSRAVARSFISRSKHAVMEYGL
jgi:hypothetical protein